MLAPKAKQLCSMLSWFLAKCLHELHRIVVDESNRSCDATVNRHSD
jgi:hypothetical protein